MAKSLEEMISSCDIFAGCEGVEALPCAWRDADGQLEKLVVFGYGSVIWKPGIEFEESHVGYIDGFVRRMWQGNETHRGRKGRPGRVATLIPKPNKRTFGKAFVLKSKEQIAAAMDHLIMREISLGGYCLGFTPFHPLDSTSSSLSSSSSSLYSSPSSSFPSSPSSSSLSSMSEDEEASILSSSTIPALVFSATEENEFYLGPEKMSSMAMMIADAEGPSGHNVEYLVKICDFMRDELPPYIGDNHLFRLEKLTLQCMQAKGISFEPLAYPERFGSHTMEVTQSEYASAMPEPTPKLTPELTPSFNPLSLTHGNYGHLDTDDDAMLSANRDPDSVQSSVGVTKFRESDDTRKDFNHSSNLKDSIENGRKAASKSKTDRRDRRRTGLRLGHYVPEQ